MKRRRKLIFIVCGIVVLLLAAVAIHVLRPANDGRTVAERRQIADALFAMLHSPLTNEVDDIKPDDPRVPEVIRNLHPVGFMITGTDSVVLCSGKPAEYHLTKLPNERNTWTLSVAGPGYLGHREILRFVHD